MKTVEPTCPKDEKRCNFSIVFNQCSAEQTLEQRLQFKFIFVFMQLVQLIKVRQCVFFFQIFFNLCATRDCVIGIGIGKKA
jgi:hypothetical protein